MSQRFYRAWASAVLALQVGIASDAFAQAAFSSSAAGTTTANFLKLGVGARGEALGEAYSALADDASAIYWNPAALTQIPEKTASLTVMHAPYLNPTYFDFAGYAQNTGDAGVFGGGLQYFSGGSITQTDTTGTSIGTFNPYDLAASLAYAHTWNGFGLGLAGKFIRSQLLDAAQTGAVDIGILSPAYVQDRLRLAFVASNLGGRMTFDQESFGLPLNLKMGSAYRLTPAWNAMLDLNFPIDNNPYAAMGSEYLWKIGGWTLAGRVGYNARTSSDIDGITGVTAGFGLNFQTTSIDYAMVPLGSLGMTQRISISLKFQTGSAKSLLRKPEQMPAEIKP